MLVSLFLLSLAAFFALVLAIFPLTYWLEISRLKLLVLLPATAACLALFFGGSRWPVLMVHLSLVGVILNQWEDIAFTGIPFLTLNKALFFISAAILVTKFITSHGGMKPLVFPTAALAHLPLSFICLGSMAAYSYNIKTALRWVIAPVTLPFLGIVLAQFVPNRASAIRLVKAFALYSFFPMGVAALESFFHRRIGGAADFLMLGVDDIFRVAGNFDNPNDFVVLMLFSIPILLLWAVQTPRWFVRIALLAGSLFEGAILIKTYSRSGYVSMAFTLAALVFLGRGKIRKVGLVVCLAGIMGLLLIPDARDRLLTLAGIRTTGAGQSQAIASLNFRKQLMLVSWWEFLEHPVLGVGFSNIGARAKTYSSMLYLKNTAENTYLEVLAEMGLVGFTAYLFFLLAAWRAMWTGLSRCRGDWEVEPLFVALAAGYCGFAFNSLFDTNLSDNLPWVLLPVMVHLTPRSERPAC
jgi:O-antigen ligase